MIEERESLPSWINGKLVFPVMPPRSESWSKGNCRFELKQRADGSMEMVFYIRDATPEEAERALRGASVMAHRMHFKLVFEGDVSAVEAFAAEHGIEIIS